MPCHSEPTEGQGEAAPPPASGSHRTVDGEWCHSLSYLFGEKSQSRGGVWGQALASKVELVKRGTARGIPEGSYTYIFLGKKPAASMRLGAGVGGRIPHGLDMGLGDTGLGDAG